MYQHSSQRISLFISSFLVGISFSTFSRIAQRCSLGLRSGDILGKVKVFTAPGSVLHCVYDHCLVVNIPFPPSISSTIYLVFWCNTIIQSSIKIIFPTPAELMQPCIYRLSDCPQMVLSIGFLLESHP